MNSVFSRSPLWPEEGDDGAPGAPGSGPDQPPVPAPRPRINLLTWDGPAVAPTPPATPKAPPETREQKNNTIKDLRRDERVIAFLQTLAADESGGRYDVLGGGARFTDYSDHPHAGVKGGRVAGAYQFTPSTWAWLARDLALPDFSPDSQDRAAIHLFRTTGGVDKLLKGDVPGAIMAAGMQWDVFPKSEDGRTNSRDKVVPLQGVMDKYQRNLARVRQAGGI
jgi:muramidase (phage lysozyme)